VSFAAITLCVASQRVFVVVYFVIHSVRKLLDTPSHVSVQVVRVTYWLYKNLFVSARNEHQKPKKVAKDLPEK
jgi:hypothetical protein